MAKTETSSIEEINFKEVKEEKYDPLNTEPIVDNLRKDQFQAPPAGTYQAPLPEADNIAQPQPNIGGNGSGAPPPNMGGFQPNGGAPNNGQQQQQRQYVNPEFNDIPNSEKMEAAAQAAQVFLTLYGTMWSAAPKLIQVSEKRLKKMEKNGEINLRIPLVESESNPTPTTVKDVVAKFNATAGKGYELTPEFVEAVMPPLTREFAKNGVGMSDTQLLYFLFGQDIVTKGITIVKGMGDRKDLIEQLKETTEAYNKRATTFSPPPQPQAQPQPSRQAREPEETRASSEQTSNEGFTDAQVVSSNDGGGVKPELIIHPTTKDKRDRRSTRKREQKNK